MNAYIRRACVGLGSLGGAAVIAGAAQAAPMSVQVKDAQVRARPSYLGTVAGSLKYGDRVEAGTKQGDWYQVSAPSGVQGWLHSSALTAKRIVMKAGGADVQAGASGEEVALAGKGFNSDVEARYKAQNKSLNFEAVDRLESARVAPREMKDFLEAGEVAPAKGGAR